MKKKFTFEEVWLHLLLYMDLIVILSESNCFSAKTRTVYLTSSQRRQCSYRHHALTTVSVSLVSTSKTGRCSDCWLWSEKGERGRAEKRVVIGEKRRVIVSDECCSNCWLWPQKRVEIEFLGRGGKARCVFACADWGLFGEEEGELFSFSHWFFYFLCFSRRGALNAEANWRGKKARIVRAVQLF